MAALSKSLVVLVLAGLLCAAGVAVPDDAQAKIILKVTTQSTRPGTPRADYLVHFKNGVAKRTNGEIEVQIYWANSLVHAKEALEAVQVGTADMAIWPSPISPIRSSCCRWGRCPSPSVIQ